MEIVTIMCTVQSIINSNISSRCVVVYVSVCILQQIISNPAPGLKRNNLVSVTKFSNSVIFLHNKPSAITMERGETVVHSRESINYFAWWINAIVWQVNNRWLPLCPWSINGTSWELVRSWATFCGREFEIFRTRLPLHTIHLQHHSTL